MSLKVVSFFAGCGGLDLGFEQAGFQIVWANEYDETIHETYQFNHPNTFLCKKDIRILSTDEIPDCDGFIGGPPCQPWSEGGKQLGLNDERGKLFLDYLNFSCEVFPSESSVFEGHISVPRVFLGDRHRSGVKIADTILYIIHGNVGMT